jgi:hypothetical protein
MYEPYNAGILLASAYYTRAIECYELFQIISIEHEIRFQKTVDLWKEKLRS